MSLKRTTIQNLIRKATLSSSKMYIIKEDSIIVDYLIDNGKSHILKEFESEEDYNTGVCVFFDHESEYKTLVVIMSMKFFDRPRDNGLIALVLDDIHINPNGTVMIKDLMKASSPDNKELHEAVNFSIDQKITQSINHHAGT